jgi:hypothetical protein
MQQPEETVAELSSLNTLWTYYFTQPEVSNLDLATHLVTEIHKVNKLIDLNSDSRNGRQTLARYCIN